MSANKIISSTVIGTIKNSGRSIRLGYATETDKWKRLLLAQQTQDNLAKAMEKADIPDGATTAIMS